MKNIFLLQELVTFFIQKFLVFTFQGIFYGGIRPKTTTNFREAC